MDSSLHHIYAKIVITKYVVKNTIILNFFLLMTIITRTKKLKKKSCLNLNLIQIKIF